MKAWFIVEKGTNHPLAAIHKRENIKSIFCFKTRKAAINAGKVSPDLEMWLASNVGRWKIVKGKIIIG